MSVEPATPLRLLELVYGLLSEQEAAELRAAVSGNSDLATAYARAQAAAGLLRRAARWPGPPVPLRRPEILPAVPFVRVPLAGEPPGPKPPLVRSGPEVRRPWARWAGWTVGIATAVLVLLALGGYVYHRMQLGDMAAGPVRVLLVGPPWLEVGHSPRFSLLTTSLPGQPVSAQVELGFWSPEGQHLGGHKEQTDAQGRLEVALPADSRILHAPHVRLTVQVVRDKVRPSPPLEAWLPVRHEGTALHLALEKTEYRPGETVRFRALALKRSGLTPSAAGRLHYAIRDASGAIVAGSDGECALFQGLAWGECRLSATVPPGQYTLVVAIADTTSEVGRTFSVPSGTAAATAGTKKLDVAFAPEGGALVAGLQNRVYFAMRDTQGKALRASGRIVDGQNRPVALAETGDHGLGAFSFEPVAGQSYRLVIETPEGIEDSPPLPAVVNNSGIVLSTGRSVFEAGKPLEFVVRCREAGIPLVAAAWCRGLPVGQQAFVTQTQASAAFTHANPVILPVDESATGAIRLCIFDYRNTPPRLVAERLVFRQPARRLNLQPALPRQDSPMASAAPAPSAVPPPGPGSPHWPRQIALQITDEEGKPAPAVLAAWPSDADSARPGAAIGDSLLASVLLGPDLVEAGVLRHLGPMPLRWPESEKTLDFVLGMYGGSSQAHPGRPPHTAVKQARGGAVDAAGTPTKQVTPTERTDRGPAPCTLLDNLAQLKTEYQSRLETYRKHRTRVLNTVITLIFFGGVGLVLFVGMANLLNIPCGLRLWLPTLLTAGVCLAVGLELLHPERHVGPAQGVAFSSYQHPRPPVTGAQADGHSPPNGEPTHAERAPSIAAVPASSAVSAASGRAGRPRVPSARRDAFWHPAIFTDRDGKAVLDLNPPPQGAASRLLVEAYAPTGRLGGLELELTGDSLAIGGSQTP